MAAPKRWHYDPLHADRAVATGSTVTAPRPGSPIVLAEGASYPGELRNGQARYCCRSCPNTRVARRRGIRAWVASRLAKMVPLPSSSARADPRRQLPVRTAIGRMSRPYPLAGNNIGKRVQPCPRGAVQACCARRALTLSCRDGAEPLLPHAFLPFIGYHVLYQFEAWPTVPVDA